MDEAEFSARAEQALARIEAALEACADELDYETKPGGILEVEFDDGSKLIINRHGAAREIWVAARSGGFHFRPEGERWVDTREGSDLFAKVADLVSRQSGGAVRLAFDAG